MTRWRRVRVPLLLVVLLVLVPVATVLSTGTGASGAALDPAGAQPGGARALARVLGGQGVRVTRVERASAARRALDASAAPATLAVTRAGLLDPRRLADLAGRAGTVVLLAPTPAAVRAVTPALAPLPRATPGSRPGSTATVPAGCADPDARAAGSATGGGTRLRAAPGGRGGAAAATTCFGGSYAVAVDGPRTVRVLGQGAVASNEHLDEAGNAALALRALGSAPRLVWLVASPLDAAAPRHPSVAQLLPAWVPAVAVQLLVAGAAAVVWRARRLGALVVEPLPVVVRSVETAQGRAALYRASGDRAAAARALRGAALWRLAARLGLPPAAPPDQVAAQVAAATGRPAPGVSALLLGPPPADDAGLVALADDLDALAPTPAPTPAPAPAPTRRGTL